MSMIIALVAVGALAGLSFALGAAGLTTLLGVVVPYIAILLFICGFAYRIIEWARVPVPFRIPTTCGQQESLSFIKQAKIENPSSMGGVLVRMFLEVFFFRSLLRNTRATVSEGIKYDYTPNPALWIAGLAFHWSFLFIFVRHFRLFVNPVPGFVSYMEGLDVVLWTTLPSLYITDGIILLAVTYLFLRRVIFPQIRHMSLPADYFPLFLILGIVITGILMRYSIKVDVTSVKTLMGGLFSFRPSVPDGIGSIFYVHLALVSTLIGYFPFSKLMHAAGVFMSPARNMVNNSRMVRHINPWNDPNIKPHSYEAYENDFRKMMKMVDLPLEKELEEDE
jgi:nitrate reductase gamma subunit